MEIEVNQSCLLIPSQLSKFAYFSTRVCVCVRFCPVSHHRSHMCVCVCVFVLVSHDVRTTTIGNMRFERTNIQLKHIKINSRVRTHANTRARLHALKSIISCCVASLCCVVAPAERKRARTRNAYYIPRRRCRRSFYVGRETIQTQRTYVYMLALTCPKCLCICVVRTCMFLRP